MSINCTGLRAVDWVGLFPFHNCFPGNWLQPSWWCYTSSTKHYLDPKVSVTAIGKKYVPVRAINGQQKYQWTTSSKPSLPPASISSLLCLISHVWKRILGISQLPAARLSTSVWQHNISISNCSNTTKHRGTEIASPMAKAGHNYVTTVVHISGTDTGLFFCLDWWGQAQSKTHARRSLSCSDCSGDG